MGRGWWSRSKSQRFRFSVLGSYGLCLCLWGSLGFVPWCAWAGNGPMDAQWVWQQSGAWSESTPAISVRFRRALPVSEPATGVLRVMAADRFTIWCNGRLLGKGDALKVHRFSLNGLVERGTNQLAVLVESDGGPTGFFLDGEIRGQSGRSEELDTPQRWKVAPVARNEANQEAWLQVGFDDRNWSDAVSLGNHAQSPWKSIQFDQGYLSRYLLAPGFELERVAEPELVGSSVAMSWGSDGRLLVSRERGPILALRDLDRDGKYEVCEEFSNAVTNCQGLCMVFDELYAVGDGPQGTGIYRLPDTDHDGRADVVHLVAKHDGGMGEHGPHNIVLGPDGHLYHNLGNHAHLRETPDPNSGVLISYEGDLLQPRFEDAIGHARGVRAPGGTIWRFLPATVAQQQGIADPGTRWFQEVVGFRNHYDIGFNRLGELFTFDSDMEWDVGAPWYRPVRVNHCLPGAEFGWRSGSAKWPDYYADSLPATADIGRGSPTGVVFYEHQQFPTPWQNAFLIADWSMGRILAVQLQPQDGSWIGSANLLVEGNPLNVSDLEVASDGSVLFCTGGRNTEGGVYRIRYEYAAAPANQVAATAIPEQLTVAAAVALLQQIPQLHAYWAQEQVQTIKQRLGGAQFHAALQQLLAQPEPAARLRGLTLAAMFGPKPTEAELIAKTNDTDVAVRAFATWLLGAHTSTQTRETLQALFADPEPWVRRRAVEAMVRAGLQPELGSLLPLLTQDRFVRFAARNLLERLPVEQWQDKVLTATEPKIQLEGLLALVRCYQRDGGKQNEKNPTCAKILNQLNALLHTTTDQMGDQQARTEQLLSILRIAQLALQFCPTPSSDAVNQNKQVERLADALLRLCHTPGVVPMSVARESARLLAYLQRPAAAAWLVQQMEQAELPADQVHFVLCGTFLNEGWTADLNQRLVAWYERTRPWEGGNSFPGYLANFFTKHLDHFSSKELTGLLHQWRQYPYALRVVLERVPPQRFDQFGPAAAQLIRELEADPGAPWQSDLLENAFLVLGRADDANSQTLLRQMYDEYPERRTLLARALAEHPSSENRPYYFQTLKYSSDSAALQACLKALVDLPPTQLTAEEARILIVAGLKLGEQGGLAATNVLRQWTKQKRDFNRRQTTQALQFYQEWFAKQFPEQPPAEIPKEEASQSRYSLEQLVQYLEKNPRGRQGDVERGRQIYTKANCVKCHKFGNEGLGVGPDLTTVRRRFQKREIVEAVLYPSQVISEQYRSVMVATVEGAVHVGMPLPESNETKLVLLLSDTSKLELARANVEEEKTSPISVMPAGLFNNLSLEEIADLFAYLEISRTAKEPGVGNTIPIGKNEVSLKP